MTQAALNEQLTAYLDDELDGAERAAVEQALAADPALRAELEALRAASGFLRARGPVEAPVGFHERVMAQIAVEPVPAAAPAAPEPWHKRLLAPLRRVPAQGLALAAVAAAALFSVLSAPPRAPEPTPEAPAPVALAPAPGRLPALAPDAPEAQTLAQAPDAGGPPGTVVTALPRMSDEGQQLIDELVSSRAADADGLALVDDPATPAEGASGEVQPEAPVAAALHAALAYRLEVGGGAALRQLDELARTQQGRLLDAAGAPLAPETLEAGQRQLVLLRVPASRVTAVVLGLKQLGVARHLGGQMDQLYGDDVVDISVEVHRR